MLGFVCLFCNRMVSTVSTVSTMSTVSIILLDSVNSVNSYSAVLEFIQELTGKYTTATLSSIDVWVQTWHLKLKNKCGRGQKRLCFQSTLLGYPPRTILSSPLRRGLRRNCTITDRWQGRAPSKGRTSCLSLQKGATIIFGKNNFFSHQSITNSYLRSMKYIVSQGSFKVCFAIRLSQVKPAGGKIGSLLELIPS